ncbi:MAG: type IV toxin-antitoxin system AbiEi family antitoxin domain-containing protein [Spirochaetaceae bacterium]|nr:type IV toxin-antitoxin system AbiEi family antitoxin domain-containing protein [Spirochaetaceae bacterium]
MTNSTLTGELLQATGALAREHGGYLRTREVTRAGIHNRYLARLVEDGTLCRIKNEAIRDFLGQPGRNVDRSMEYAQALRMVSTMETYLRILL